MAKSVECKCDARFTCRYCLQNAPAYFGYDPNPVTHSADYLFRKENETTIPQDNE